MPAIGWWDMHKREGAARRIRRVFCTFLHAYAHKGIECILNDLILLPCCINQLIGRYLIRSPRAPSDTALFCVEYTRADDCEGCGEPCECQWGCFFSEERHQMWSSWELLGIFVDHGDELFEMEDTMVDMIARRNTNKKISAKIDAYDSAVKHYYDSRKTEPKPMLYSFLSPKDMKLLYRECPESRFGKNKVSLKNKISKPTRGSQFGVQILWRTYEFACMRLAARTGNNGLRGVAQDSYSESQLFRMAVARLFRSKDRINAQINPSVIPRYLKLDKTSH